ncbi:MULTISPECIES: hypothetical protein [unclassified Burkholderia]|uniref:hypothetical protein n=1 Tax=unclassified Burkholderia TaxID=2613784 RepID=UPI000F5E3819|nr:MULTISPECIES: hypothetical protein [unclassified Burkholderia]
MKKANVPTTARHVLRTIRMRLAMGEAFPSYQAIADDVGISRRSAIKTVGDCVENGWLAVRKRSKAPGHNDTNVYGLTLHPEIWRSSSGRECAKDCVAPAAVVNDDHRGSEPRSPGVVIHDHQGSEPHSPKQGSNEERNEERNEEESVADATDAPFAGKPGEPVCVNADYLRRYCTDRSITNVAGLGLLFEGYARNAGHRFEGTAWLKPAAERVFRVFARTVPEKALAHEASAELAA